METTLRQLQLRMLDILIELDQLCRRNNIPYWLDYGTLLGAVRHGGFIPWDDDLDICIPDEHYDRFIALAGRQLPQWLMVQTEKSEPESRMGGGLIKIRDKKSLYLQPHDNLRGRYHKGAFVDVFRYIQYPKMSNATFRYLSRRISIAYNFLNYNPKLNLKNIIGYFVYPISLVFHRAVFRLIDITRGKGTHWFSTPERYGSGLFTQHDDLFPLQEIEFEGHTFFAPHNPEARLRDNFGDDFMTVPPPEKRRTHALYFLPDADAFRTQY